MGNHRSSTVAWAATCGLAVGFGAIFLAGCPTVDLGDSPEDVGLCNPAGGVDYFQNQIWPTYIQNSTKACTMAGGCHAEGGGNTLNFMTMPVDFAANYKATQIFLNCATPNASELLTRPLAGTDLHGGGDIFPSLTDPAVVVFLAWFQ